MKRICAGKMNQIVIIPTIGILWDTVGIFISFVWLNISCSVLLFRGEAAGPTESSPLAGSTAKKAGKIAEEMHIPPEDIAEKIFDRKVQEQKTAKA